MKTKYVLLAIAGLITCGKLRVHADWSKALPRVNNTVLDLSRPSKHGIAVILRSRTATPSISNTNGVVFFDTTGREVFRHLVNTVEFNISDTDFTAVALNQRQLLMEGGNGIRLLTLGEDSKLTSVDYRFSTSQRHTLRAREMAENDLSGFYYVDSVGWTLTRVDFPRVTTPTGNAVIKIQSAVAIEGPWNTIAEDSVSITKPIEFIRVELEQSR